MKKQLFIIALLCASAFGQGVIVPPQTALKTVNGLTTPIAGATITVCAVNTGGLPCSPALANALFKDAGLTQPLSNPFFADTNGNYNFAIAPGNYTVTVTASGFSGYSYQVSSGGGTTSSLTLQTNGTNNVSQSVLNQVAGSGMTLTNSGNNVTFASAVPSVFGRTGNVTAQSGDYTFNQIGSGSNLGALTIGTGGTFTPTGAGQIVSTLGYMQPGISAPTVNFSANSGTLPGHTFNVVVSYNNALGETLPSVATVVTLTSCGTGCSMTVTAPTFPTGYTSYNVYDVDTSGGSTIPLKQTASGNCVAITGNCVITSPAAGSAVLTVPTAFPTPPNAQAFNGMYGEQPSVWTPDANGNYTPWIAMDWSTCAVGNFSPCGTPTFLKQTFFTDYANSVTAESGSNCLICMNHLFGTGTSANNQDRILWLSGTNPANDTTPRHGIEALQAEIDYTCTILTCINGSPDGELTTASFQMSDQSTAAYNPPSFGTNAIRAEVFKGGTASTTQYSAVNALVGITHAGFTNGATAASVRGACINSTGSPLTGLGCYGLIYTPLTSAARPANGTVVVYAVKTTGFTPTTADYFLQNDNHAYPSLLNGNIGLIGISNTDVAALPVSGSITLTGSLASAQMANSWATLVTASCSGGASTYSYKLVAHDGNGGVVASTTTNNATSCTNPLTSGNPVTLNFGSIPALSSIYAQAASIDVYRASGPMATGRIGTISCNTDFPIFGCSAFVDSGLAVVGDGSGPVTTNTTGETSSAGYFAAAMNHVQLTGDFTSAANTSLQTITGLSWNLDTAAKNYSFHCSLMYSQATAAASMQFGIQVATANPTNVNAKGRVDTSTSAQTSGVLNGLTTTTATSIVTFTPSASATVFGADLDGSIEVPAHDAGNVVNIMVQTSNSSDLPTVKRGSYCYLY